MITKTKYLKALKTVKTYEMQSQKKVAVKNGECIISIDDAWYNITYGDNVINCNSEFELRDILMILLTEKQQIDFTGDYTCRDFTVKNELIEDAMVWIKSDKNPWRRKHTTKKRYV